MAQVVSSLPRVQGKQVTATGLVSSNIAGVIRQVLAATNHLHGAIADLRSRLRDLETALNTLHVARLGFAHPLLDPDDGEDEDDNEASTRPHTSRRLQSTTFSLAMADDTSLRYYGIASGAFVLSVKVYIYHEIDTVN
jgi:hypothetical protein